MKRKALTVGLCICLMLTVTGCKGRVRSLKLADIKDETVLLRSDGSVQSGAYESFDQLYYDEDDLISEETTAICDYAANGALFYGKHLAKNTSYKKILAIGVSGNEKRHRITPIFVDERQNYKELPETEGFILFNEDNIDEYYIKEILSIRNI